MIQRRKMNNEKDKSQQYMESTYLKDLIGSRQNTSELIDKFVKTNQIDVFSCKTNTQK